MRSRLLSRHLHRVFDIDPHPVVGLRLDRGGAFAWSIADDVLRLTPDDASGDVIVSLADHAVSEIGAAIAEHGYSAVEIGADVADRLATCLLPGSGHSAATNGNRILATQNLILLLLDAVGDALWIAAEDLVKALAQMYPLQSEGDWADYWGRLFGVWRRTGEGDVAYTTRIFFEVTRPRSNRYAIKSIINEALGTSVEVFEPWTRVLHLSGYAPTLSVCRFRDRRYWTHCTIGTWGAPYEDVIPWANRSRAAGVFVGHHDRIELELDASSSTPQSGGIDNLGVTELASQSLEILAGRAPQAGEAFGNEPWVWVQKTGLPQSVVGITVASHEAARAIGSAHQHGYEDMRPQVCPAGWALVTELCVDGSTESIYLGWRLDGDWYYARIGSDTLSGWLTGYDAGREAVYSVINGRNNKWLTLVVPLADFGISSDVVCDGIVFALQGGQCWFGKSTVCALSLNLSMQSEMQLQDGSGASGYSINGQSIIYAYTLGGVLVQVFGISEEYGEDLYRVGDLGGTTTTTTIYAGHGWLVSDLSAISQLAGNNTLTLTEAVWVSGVNSITISVSQTS